jgi:hypothetical protein
MSKGVVRRDNYETIPTMPVNLSAYDMEFLETGI